MGREKRGVDRPSYGLGSVATCLTDEEYEGVGGAAQCQIGKGRLGARPKHVVLILVLASFGVLVSLKDWTLASPGDLDTTFGTSGKVTTDFDGFTDAASGLAIQPDGKIVAAGYAETATDFNFTLARYNPDGTLDTSFGTGGKVTTGFGSPSQAMASSIAVRRDGRIVVAGQSWNADSSNSYFTLAQYTPDGSLDTSFGMGGKVITDFGACCPRARALAIQPDGKVVAAGSPAGNYFALARYKRNGRLDRTFGIGGIVITDLGASSEVGALTLLADGRILAAGSYSNGSYSPPSIDFALACYKPDGTLDSSFGTGGWVTTNFGHTYGSPGASAIAVQTDGKIVVAGGDPAALARYNPSGSLDTTFGVNGNVTYSHEPSFVFTAASSVAIQSNGKIVVGGLGFGGDSLGYDFVLVRHNADGSLDTTFGVDGKVTTDFFGSHDGASAIALQADGRIVAVGSSYDTGAGDYDFALARYNGDVFPLGWPFIESVGWEKRGFGTGDCKGVDGKRNGDHCGDDWYAQDWNWGSGNSDLGKVLLSAASGQVIFSGSAPQSVNGYGQELLIRLNPPFDTFALRYTHLQEIWVAKGDSVCLGSPVGVVGFTGLSGGGENTSHLHAAFYQNIDEASPKGQTGLYWLELGATARTVASGTSATKFAASFSFDPGIKASGCSDSFVIAGRVTTPTGLAVSGVTVELSGPVSIATNPFAKGTGGGNYAFHGLPNGTYTVTPARKGYIFDPPSRTVTIGGGHISGADFSAAH